MIINFEFFLTLTTLLTGFIALFDQVVLTRKRIQAKAMPIIVEYSRSFFPVLLFVLVFRSFIMEPFRIPSSSLEPSLLIGDFIVVNKFDYGLRMPVTDNKILSIHSPKTGEIIVFRYPVDPGIDYIKRVIGTPGDKIRYANKILYINGKIAPQQLVNSSVHQYSVGEDSPPVELKSEDLLGTKHQIYQRPNVPARDFEVTVPEGQYFVMGDNRDDSNDSRYWGFVPEENLIGKAMAIWFSWDTIKHKVRWHRLGHAIH